MPRRITLSIWEMFEKKLRITPQAMKGMNKKQLADTLLKASKRQGAYSKLNKNDVSAIKRLVDRQGRVKGLLKSNKKGGLFRELKKVSGEGIIVTNYKRNGKVVQRYMRKKPIKWERHYEATLIEASAYRDSKGKYNISAIQGKMFDEHPEQLWTKSMVSTKLYRLKKQGKMS